MRIGYARVSTQDQHPELQLDALAAAGCEQVFLEKISGKNKDRPEFETCLKVVRKGDTLVVWRLDRLGRSLKDLVGIVHDLQERGVGFQSLAENIAIHLDKDASKQKHEVLSGREFEIMIRLANGKSLQEIGNELFISVKTVSTYRSRIMEKMEFNKNTELTRYCMGKNLI